MCKRSSDAVKGRPVIRPRATYPRVVGRLPTVLEDLELEYVVLSGKVGRIWQQLELVAELPVQHDLEGIDRRAGGAERGVVAVREVVGVED